MVIGRESFFFLLVDDNVVKINIVYSLVGDVAIGCYVCMKINVLRVQRAHRSGHVYRPNVLECCSLANVRLREQIFASGFCGSGALASFAARSARSV